MTTVTPSAPEAPAEKDQKDGLLIPSVIICAFLSVMALTIDGDLGLRNAQSNWIMTDQGAAFCLDRNNGSCTSFILKSDM